VTARTRWRGLVKRRIVPVRAAPDLTGQSPVLQAGKQVGQLLSCVATDSGWLGLASLRLEAIAAAEAGQQLGLEDGQPLELAIPDWMRPLPQQK
jgi:folate-binding Fe-S cluster repair protein YgfZ